MPASHYLITVNRQWRVVGISASILVVMAGAYVAAAATGTMSLQVAAGVDIVAYLGYGIVMQVAAYRLAGQPTSQLLSLMPMYVLPTIELLVGAVVADTLVPRLDPTGVLLHAGLQAGLFGVTWAALAWLHLRTHRESRGDLLMVTELIGRAVGRIWAAVRRPKAGASSDSGPRV